MTDDRESNERDYEISRKLSSLNRRIERLEDTQVTGRELNRGFDRIYEEIDDIEDKLDILQSEFHKFRNEINEKLDTLLKHITGIN
jgi:predicted  nucleic acid-binding Zn-ribbon protein